MKFNNIFSLAVVLATMVAIQSCEKNELRLTITDLPTDKAYVRFGLFSPAMPSVMIKVNDIKINSSTSGSSGVFPATSNFPDYSAVVPSGKLKLSLPNTGTGNDSVVLFTADLNLTAQKFYAVTVADTGIDRTLFAVEDERVALPDSGFANLRIINAMAKGTAISLIKIDSLNATTVSRDTIVRNLSYKSGSAYIRIPVSPVNSFYRFRIINAAGFPLGAVITPPAANLINRRTMTIYAGGIGTGTATYAPFLSGSFIYNQ
jgi:hypothetical protein